MKKMKEKRSLQSNHHLSYSLIKMEPRSKDRIQQAISQEVDNSELGIIDIQK